MYRLRQAAFLLVAGAIGAFAIYLLLALLVEPAAMLWYWHDRLYDLRMLIVRRNLEWASVGAGYALVLLKTDWDAIGTGPLLMSSSRKAA
jgi:hypothetical protein